MSLDLPHADAPGAGACSPLQAWREGVQSGRWQHDPAQAQALEALDRVYFEVCAALDEQTGWRRWLSAWRQPEPVRGLYLWGGVGRGKTFLLDLFFDGLPTTRKLRLHFHRFMGRVHAELATLKEVEDPLAVVADRFAAEVKVLCFDEFFVSDIGDAMLLGRLLKHLFARGLTLLATSNVEPKNLYRDGLQRAKFLPAIALLEQHCEVLELHAGQDWRLRALEQAAVYYSPLGAATDAALEAAFLRLATTARDPRPHCMIHGRPIPVHSRAGDLIWFDFAALCEGPRAAADYIEIARSFPTVFLSGVPVLDRDREDPARRFVHLVDEFYDRAVKLIVGAAAPPSALYRGERLRFEFQRTESRLIEMQSQAYLAREHRG